MRHVGLYRYHADVVAAEKTLSSFHDGGLLLPVDKGIEPFLVRDKLIAGHLIVAYMGTEDDKASLLAGQTLEEVVVDDVDMHALSGIEGKLVDDDLREEHMVVECHPRGLQPSVVPPPPEIMPGDTCSWREEHAHGHDKDVVKDIPYPRVAVPENLYKPPVHSCRAERVAGPLLLWHTLYLFTFRSI